MDVQDITDDVATRVARPAVVEDCALRLIAYSEHDEPLDQVRKHTILHRRSTADVAAWVRRSGIHSTTRPFHTPGEPDLGIVPRLAAPIRYRSLMLGYLWLLDPGMSLRSEDVDIVARAATLLGHALYERSVTDRADTERTDAALRSLLLGEESGQDDVAALLSDRPQSAGDSVAAVLTAEPCQPQDEVRLTLNEVAEQAAIGLPLRCLRTVMDDHIAFLIAPDDGEISPSLDRIFGAVEQELAGAANVASWAVGVGEARSLPEIRGSYQEALSAARAATRFPEVGHLAYWRELGVYRLLSTASTEGMSPAALHPGLAGLLDKPESAYLLPTLEIYLDLAANASATAKRLHLHRSSLYARLRRAEQLVGGDLDDGLERLRLHLAVKLAHLTEP